ncbi:MAG: ribonuclease R [Legionellales bacterium RIFCSPHIGHO2_12_FULL_35_11]|nr:MAG: ribonuclease R [Legionellales bacterium RIFCSPHIGHO2_12_FULL_35_11]
MSKKYYKDPFYKRENEKYEQPIPSRELILMVLEEVGRPMTKNQLVNTLEVHSEKDQEALGFRIKAMLRDGQIMQDRLGRYCLFKKINVKRGKIQAHPDGFGFFIPEDGGEDMVVSPKEMRSVMHGDVVLAFQAGFDRRGRVEVKIHEVVEHANITVVGRFFADHGVNFVVPDSKRLTQDISIPSDFKGKAKNGQMVLVELIAYPSKKTQPIGKIIHILGEHMAPGMEIEVAILAHGIPTNWSETVLEEVAKIKQEVLPEEIKCRIDLRDLPFVTIDGEDAKDFDDAVYCKKNPNGSYKLYVAIADVSHYVKPGTALDLESSRRGNSVYFPGQVVPMLPAALSNGICSLNPQVDRLCMIVEMSISTDGKITRPRFMRGVIHSKARLTYTDVGKWLENDVMDEHHDEIWPALQTLHQLYLILLKARSLRGAMDFDTTETQIEFDEKRKIKKIIPLTRNDAHKLIEECMLAANVATARYLEKAKIPVLYRVHPVPDEDKIESLRKFLGEFGLKLLGGTKPSPKDYRNVLEKIGDKPERHLIETVMLRSLKQAHYIEENSGHFGLSYGAYTHFTSPIRRYPDLLIHRAIGFLIDKKSDETFNYTTDEVAKLGRHCSGTERRADEATRDVVSWLKCEYMQDKLGQIFFGKISSVTGFGIFVELDEIYVEGLIHVTSLKNDYYSFDAVKHRLVGERGGQVYRLGDKMRVLVSRVDMDERKIDFDLAE